MARYETGDRTSRYHDVEGQEGFLDTVSRVRIGLLGLNIQTEVLSVECDPGIHNIGASIFSKLKYIFGSD